MSPRGLTQRLLPLFRKFGTGEWLAVAIIAAAVLFGLGQIGQGLYIKAKAGVAQVLLEHAWQRALKGDTAPKPWPWADTWPIAKVSVPRLGRSAIVLNGISGEALAFGPGLHPETPRPGRPGTSVIAAHRDTHFAFLADVTLGDEIKLTTTEGLTRRYEVFGTRIVDWQNSGIDASAPGENLALVTCYPFGDVNRGPLRYVVDARVKQSKIAERKD